MYGFSHRVADDERNATADESDAQSAEYKNAGEKKLAFLQRFTYGELRLLVVFIWR